MFEGCTGLTVAKDHNFQALVTASYMYLGCTNITTWPTYNLPALKSAGTMFGGCAGLTSLAGSNFGALTYVNSMFSGCVNLHTLPEMDLTGITSNTGMTNFLYNCTSLANIGGFVGLKYNLSLAGTACTIESMQNIVNKVGTVSGRTLTFTGTPAAADAGYAAAKAIAVAKGWTVTP